MAAVLWDAEGIIFIDYLQKDEAITGKYYARLLLCLKDEIKKPTASGKEKILIPS